MSDYWNYIITAVGMIGLLLVGKRLWWAWYVNIGNQVLWLTYGLTTHQWGFVVGTVGYSYVFIKNAYEWTRDHRALSKPFVNKQIGEITEVKEIDGGIMMTGRVYPEHGDIFAAGAFKGLSLGPNPIPIVDRRDDTQQKFNDALDAFRNISKDD